MTFLIGLLNVTLTAAIAVLVLLATRAAGPRFGRLRRALHLHGGRRAARLGRRATAWSPGSPPTWTIRIGLLIEAGLHLALAASRSAAVIAVALFAFGVHGALWNMVANSLRQRLTPTELQGRVGSTTLFIAAGGNCLGALLGGLVAGRFGLTAPYWVGFVVAVAVTAVTWRVFDRSTVAAAYADPAPAPDDRPATVT